MEESSSPPVLTSSAVTVPETLGRLGADAALTKILDEELVVLHDVDRTHMGIAVNLWSSLGCGDVRAVETVRMAIPAAEALRSVVEVILALAEWTARNDHDSDNDGGVRLLRRLASDPMLLPSPRLLCSDLAQALTESVADETLTVRLHTGSVAAALRLLNYISSSIEHRFAVPVADQIEEFRREVIETEAGR